MPRPERPHPRELVADWPRPEKSRVSLEEWGSVTPKHHDERLLAPARAARQFVVNVREAIGDTSIRDTATACGLDHAQLVRILNGDLWPDAITITKLEDGLNADLWPRRSER